MHPYYAFMHACMHPYYACTSCMHMVHAYMHALYACMRACMHAYYARLHAYYARINAHYACKRACYACAHAHYAFTFQLQASGLGGGVGPSPPTGPGERRMKNPWKIYENLMKHPWRIMKHCEKSINKLWKKGTVLITTLDFFVLLILHRFFIDCS